MKASRTQIGGAHYKDFVIQPAEFIHKSGLGYLEGNVIKYVCRHDKKNGLQHIEKAMHYLQLLLEMDYDAQDHNVLVCGRCGELKDSENHACVGTDSFGIGGPTWRGPR